MEMTLEEARAIVREKAEEAGGTVCPCCDKLVKVYRRKLHTEMALFLFKLFRKHQIYPRFYSMREIFPSSNKAASDGSYLPHWQLVEKSDTVNNADAPAGLYRMTDLGVRFVHNQEYVPSHVHLLNNKVVGWSDKKLNVEQSLGNKFNYSELLYG